MAGKYLRGALIQFTKKFLVPVPNVISFQFNPETISHTWLQENSYSDHSAADDDKKGHPLAVPGLPGETFSLTIVMDARDMVADGSPVVVGLATASGIYSRLAALEMLMYPTDDSQSLLNPLASTGQGQPIPTSCLPLVLFVWGPGRIVPVLLTRLEIKETLYDLQLNPTHAEATLALRVLTPDELAPVDGLMGDLARGSYKYTYRLRQALALANVANSAEGIIGMLPV